MPPKKKAQQVQQKEVKVNVSNRTRSFKTEDGGMFHINESLIQKYSLKLKRDIQQSKGDETIKIQDISKETFTFIEQFLLNRKEKQASPIHFPIKSNISLRYVMDQNDAMLMEKVDKQGDLILKDLLDAATILQIQQLRKRLFCLVALKMMKFSVQELKEQYQIPDIKSDEQALKLKQKVFLKSLKKTMIRKWMKNDNSINISMLKAYFNQKLQHYKLQIKIIFIREMHSMERMDQSVKDIIAGFVSGWTQVFIMQPFQIVKIRLQTQTQANPYYKGIGDCFKKIRADEGLASFYKGTVSPLIGIGFQASAMFFTYQACKRFFNRFKQNKKDRLPLQFVALSGAIASIPTASIAAPVQHARIRIQIQKAGEAELYKGSIDAAISISKNYGLSGMYRGFFPTLGRECIGLTAYFTTYESIIRASIRKDQKLTQASLFASLIGGAGAGIVFFLCAYPMDYCKTLLQTDHLEKSQQKYRGLFHVAKTQFKTGGLSIFYKGLGVTLYRAATVNAGGLFAFQGALRFMGKSQDSQ